MSDYNPRTVEVFLRDLQQYHNGIIVAFWSHIADERCASQQSVIIDSLKKRFEMMPGDWYRANVIYGMEDIIKRINTEAAKQHVRYARQQEATDAEQRARGGTGVPLEIPPPAEPGRSGGPPDGGGPQSGDQDRASQEPGAGSAGAG